MEPGNDSLRCDHHLLKPIFLLVHLIERSRWTSCNGTCNRAQTVRPQFWEPLYIILFWVLNTSGSKLPSRNQNTNQISKPAFGWFSLHADVRQICGCCFSIPPHYSTQTSCTSTGQSHLWEKKINCNDLMVEEYGCGLKTNQMMWHKNGFNFDRLRVNILKSVKSPFSFHLMQFLSVIEHDWTQYGLPSNHLKSIESFGHVASIVWSYCTSST